MSSSVSRDRTLLSIRARGLMLVDSFLQGEQRLQSELLRSSLVSHLHRRPESVLVIEEYDKMDCSSRNLLRQLLDKGIAANVSAARSIIILEANTGSAHMYKLLKKASGRDKLSPELAQRSLKDIVYNKWMSDACGVRPPSGTLLSSALLTQTQRTGPHGYTEDAELGGRVRAISAA